MIQNSDAKWTYHSTANYGTMVPFLVDMCIFAFPTTFVTSVFSVSIFQVARGVKTGAFL
jgi:hypothetical protein